MLWKSSPILTYQCMWYAPGMEKGAAKPCIGTNSNMGQDEADGSEERVENTTSLTPVPSASNSTQTSPDQPAPVRRGIWTTRNQLPWRYQNFGLLTDARQTGIQDAQVDLHVCLCILVWLYNTFKHGAV